jgi:hypothetical protein
MQRGTQPDIVPLHVTTERSRAGKLRGASSGVIRQRPLLRLSPLQRHYDLRSARHDLRQAQRVHHRAAGSLGEGRWHGMG